MKMCACGMAAFENEHSSRALPISCRIALSVSPTGRIVLDPVLPGSLAPFLYSPEQLVNSSLQLLRPVQMKKQIGRMTNS